MNPSFFRSLEVLLTTERLDAYRQDKVGPAVTLARYLWNMALCEALYSPLQLAEVALRNSIHREFSARAKTDTWYDVLSNQLPSWQNDQLTHAKQTLVADGKPITPGRVVAALSFGFWTGFLNKTHAGNGLGHTLAHRAFAQAPRSERDLKKLDARWREIRDLRNRVFHHERIIHWSNLPAQHRTLLETIGWMSPEALVLASTLDRFGPTYQQGLAPYLAQIRQHWPDTSSSAKTNSAP